MVIKYNSDEGIILAQRLRSAKRGGCDQAQYYLLRLLDAGLSDAEGDAAWEVCEQYEECANA